MQPDGRGKYVFDIGCEQHGMYVPIEQDKEEKNEEDEPSANVLPKWKAGVVTALHVKTPEEEEEERMMAEAERVKAELGEG